MSEQDGPGHGDAGAVFTDGGYRYQVVVVPALFPLWAADMPLSGGLIGDLIFEVGGRAVANLADSRWKVAIMRAGRSRISRFRVVGLELFSDLDEAEARRTEIRRHWARGQYDQCPVLSHQDRTSIRRGRRI